MSTLDRGGTDGRVYGGVPSLIHIPDGHRGDLGAALATDLDRMMRVGAVNRTQHERAAQRLCPGCYMIVGFNMLIALADRNGQPRRELARSMIRAFEKLEANPEAGMTEEIDVILDPCEMEVACA